MHKKPDFIKLPDEKYTEEQLDQMWLQRHDLEIDEYRRKHKMPRTYTGASHER